MARVILALRRWAFNVAGLLIAAVQLAISLAGTAPLRALQVTGGSAAVSARAATEVRDMIVNTALAATREMSGRMVCLEISAQCAGTGASVALSQQRTARFEVWRTATGTSDWVGASEVRLAGVSIRRPRLCPVTAASSPFAGRSPAGRTRRCGGR